MAIEDAVRLTFISYMCGHLILTSFSEGRIVKNNSETDCPWPERFTSEMRGGPMTYDTRGVIQSRRYPLQYVTPACSQWFVSGRSPTDAITLSFTDVDLGTGSKGSCKDRLFIGPTDTAPYYRTICGHFGQNSAVPPPFLTSRSNLWIKFIAYDNVADSVTSRGFNLSYIAGPPRSVECEEDEFRCRSGRCIYGSWVCNGLNECDDASDEASCPTGVRPPTAPAPTYCGFDKFLCVSKATREKTCFRNFRRCDRAEDCLDGMDERNCSSRTPTCSRHVDGTSGWIASPNYPAEYPVSTRCVWLVHVPQNVVQLRVNDFSIEKRGRDLLSIYGGGEESSPTIWRYTGTNHPPALLESTTNRLLLVFETDRSVSERGFNFTFQQKGYCILGQSQCLFAELDCYPDALKCDGKWDCPLHGGDERGCFGCKSHQFYCGQRMHRCYDEREHCNGQTACFDSTDEKSCTPQLCGPHNGTFLCRNKRCIFESWRCDGTNDCLDDSDEQDCVSVPSVRVITAAVIGSVVCALLLVVALGCTCKLYALRLRDHHGPSRYDTPMSRLQAEFMRRRPPPPYNEAMTTSRPYDEVRREMSRRGRRSRHSRRLEGQRSTRGHRNTGQASTNLGEARTTGVIAEEDREAPVRTQLGNVAQQSFENMNTDGSCQLAPPGADAEHIIPMSTSDEDSNDSRDDFGMTRFDFSLVTGATAQWRRQKRSSRSHGRIVVTETDVQCNLDPSPSGTTTRREDESTAARNEADGSISNVPPDTPGSTLFRDMDNEPISLCGPDIPNTNSCSPIEGAPTEDSPIGDERQPINSEDSSLCEALSTLNMDGAWRGPHSSDVSVSTADNTSEASSSLNSWNQSPSRSRFSHTEGATGQISISLSGSTRRGNFLRVLLSSDSDESLEADLETDKAPLL